MEKHWTSTKFTLPPNGILVYTKIDDENGVRNEQELTLKGNLWFGNDGNYVYYKPTHWAYIEKDKTVSWKSKYNY